ncbi:MAG: hypothetical protein NT157_05925 [Candidatus Micrarchaeota archaeon]|nr:hypothetical protein [Candidatus Micrarchaeota archaeon]
MATSSMEPVRIKGTNVFAVGSRRASETPVSAHGAILHGRPLPLPFFLRLAESRGLMGLSGYMPSPAGTIVGLKLRYSEPLGKTLEAVDPRTEVKWIIDEIPSEAVIGGKTINPQTEKEIPLVVSIHHFEIREGQLVFDEEGKPKRQYKVAIAEKNRRVVSVTITPNDPGVFKIHRLNVGWGKEHPESGLAYARKRGFFRGGLRRKINKPHPRI